VCEQVIRVMGLARDSEIDPRQPLNELGLDSLMAVELGNALSSSLARSLPPSLLFDYPTVNDLARFLLEEAGVGAEEPRTASGGGAEDRRETHLETDAENIAGLSDEEAEALLIEELGKFEQDPHDR
jgi:acyl carrier protein